MATEAGCIFCKIAAGEIPSTTVYEDDKLKAFRDINPQAPIHILIVPKDHLASIADITDKNADLLMDIVHAANKIAEQEGIKQRGYRLVTNTGPEAGQEVHHLHFHLIGGRVLGPIASQSQGH